jgi:hypothetical protein
MSDKTDPIVTAMMALHKANTDLLWSLEWVNSLIDDLNTGRESEHIGNAAAVGWGGGGGVKKARTLHQIANRETFVRKTGFYFFQ